MEDASQKSQPASAAGSPRREKRGAVVKKRSVMKRRLPRRLSRGSGSNASRRSDEEQSEAEQEEFQQEERVLLTQQSAPVLLGDEKMFNGARTAISRDVELIVKLCRMLTENCFKLSEELVANSSPTSETVKQRQSNHELRANGRTRSTAAFNVLFKLDTLVENTSVLREVDIDEFRRIMDANRLDVVMEILEMLSARISLVPNHDARDILEIMESIELQEASSQGNASREAYTRLKPVLDDLDAERYAGLTAICVVLRALSSRAHRFGAEWVGRFILLGLYRNEPVRTFRSVRMARDAILVLMEMHETGADRAVEQRKVLDADSELKPGFLQDEDDDDEMDSEKRRHGFRGLFSFKTRRKSGSGSSPRPNETKKLHRRGSSADLGPQGAQGALPLATKQSLALFGLARASDVPESHRLSALEHEHLSKQPGKTIEECVAVFSRAPPPPPNRPPLPPGTPPGIQPRKPMSRRRRSMSVSDAESIQNAINRDQATSDSS